MTLAHSRFFLATPIGRRCSRIDRLGTERNHRLRYVEALEERIALTVSISEFSARNESLQSITGDTPDWIEIHNSSPYAVNLAGYHLTDAISDPTKWEFPSVQVAANGYLVVFASGEDSYADELHTNFALSGDGEYLALTDPLGGVVDAYSPTYPEQFTDISYGVNAAGEDVYFATATPGEANSSDEYLPALGTDVDALPGDLDDDGHVAFADFLILAQNFGSVGSGVVGDIDGDDKVAFSDFLLLAANLGRTATTSDTTITLQGDTASVRGHGVTVDGGIVTISSSGTYTLTGTLDDGQIVVDADDGQPVDLIFNGVDITSSDNAAVHIVAAEETRITLAENTHNVLSDGVIYADVVDAPDAALYSQDDLIIDGTGSLTVNGQYNDGIVSKDDLEIAGGTIHVNAVNHGLQGKDAVIVTDGDITINAGADGIQASNDEEADKGYIEIGGGSLDITAAQDGLQAETNLTVTGGSISVQTGGGHTSSSEAGKGLKAGDVISIADGQILVDSYDDAIHSDGDVTMSGGTLSLATADDGIHAEAAIQISGGMIGVTDSYEGLDAVHIAIDQAIIEIVSENDGISAASADGISSSVVIDGGSIDITAGSDAIEAEASVTITDGEVQLTTGGGSSQILGSDESAKGIKSDSELTIEGGTFVINSADDALHSNAHLVIRAGNLTIRTADDGIHADTSITIDGGSITVAESYEGIESEEITINDGDISIVSSDDGINIADGTAGTTGGGPGGGRPGGGGSTASGHLYINGGYIHVDAAGDGLDSNGSITMTDGTLIVHGPVVEFNGALDADGTILVHGGFVVAVGSSRMAEWPAAASEQETLAIQYGSVQTGGTMVHIASESGEEILTFVPAKQYSSVVVSSPSLQAGTVYDVYSGGSSTGTLTDGLYTGGTYTPGSLLGSIAI